MSPPSGTFRQLTEEEVENTSLTWRDHGPITGQSGPLPSHTKLKASRELGESPESKRSAVEILRTELQNELVDEAATLMLSVKGRFENSTDAELVKFLRARKYDVTKTIELMKGYVKYRLDYKELFENVDVAQIREYVVKGQPGVLHRRDNEGRVVMFFRMQDWDPVEYPFCQAIKTLIYVLEKLLENEETQINGVCLVEDFRDYTVRQVASVGLSDYKKMIDMLQGSFPSRFKGIHCIRQPWCFAKMYSLIKPLLKSKLFNRVFIYGEDLTEFYNAFPEEFLPEDLGGTAPPYDGEAVANMLFGEEADQEEITPL